VTAASDSTYATAGSHCSILVSLRPESRVPVAGLEGLKAMSGDGRDTPGSLAGVRAELERLTAMIGAEDVEGSEAMAHQPVQRRVKIVQRLLAEEPVEFAELAELGYDLHASWHLGVIASGTGVQDALWCVKARLGCEVLLVTCEDGTVWAWLGSARQLKVTDVEHLLSASGATEMSLAVGGWGKDLKGWRQTHREAKGALLLARRRPERVVRYADRPLLAAALENDTVATWLKEFLSPLCSRSDSASLLKTLRAYIDAECNKSSAASALEVRGHTVGSRLRRTEELLDRPLHTCLGELDVALRLTELAADDESNTEPTNMVGVTDHIGRPRPCRKLIRS
jgi:PucR-like helix-turn-helix protein/diguanylate cyclase with GGDEF domain